MEEELFLEEELGEEEITVEEENEEQEIEVEQEESEREIELEEETTVINLDYRWLRHKPQINEVELIDNKYPEDLNVNSMTNSELENLLR